MLIRDLLEEMRKGDFNKLREEASRIADIALLDEIAAILEASKDDAEKMCCYWMLGDLGRNTASPQVTDYLMARVGVEKKAKLRKDALMRLLFLKGAANAANAIAALNDKNRDVRRYAIAALAACSDPKAEEALLGIVAADDDVANTREAALALARSGTVRCVDAMVGLFRRQPRDKMHDTTVTAALLALARLGPEPALALAVELGASRSAFVNLACMLVIEQHGGEAQIDAVVSRLKSFIKKKNRQDMHYIVPLVDTKFGDELSAGLSFLQRFSDPRVDELMVFLHANSPRRFERERLLFTPNTKPETT